MSRVGWLEEGSDREHGGGEGDEGGEPDRR